MASLTWLGHASFRLETQGGKRIYVDPWLGGPTCPEDEKNPERIDAIAITHGHSDHVGDTADLMTRFPGAQIVAQVEVKGWLGAQGVDVGDLPGINKGGTQEIDGVRFTLVNAFHSSSADDGSYLGEACGLVIGLEDRKSVYFAGDTCVFGDMQLIARLYEPDVAVLPIGDWFTMGPEQAALALELLGNPRCVPCHWGTFSLLTGTPEQLAALTTAQVERILPGDTVAI